MKNKNVMEKIMQKQRGGNVILILALLAVVAWMPMKAWAVDIPAPQTSAKIHLKAGDGPAFAKLDGWYCSDTDLREVVKGMLAGVAHSGVPEQTAGDFIELFGIEEGTGWPYTSMSVSPLKMGLDAPAGGSKTYNFKCCYTKSELALIADRVEMALKVVYKMKGAAAAWAEISNWSGYQGPQPQQNTMESIF